MVARAKDLAWTIAAGHCGLRTDRVLAPVPADFPVQPDQWSAWGRGVDDEQELKTLRLNTRTGRPAGDKTFVQRLQALLGRPLRPKSVGRAKKQQKYGCAPYFTHRGLDLQHWIGYGIISHYEH